MKIKDNMYWCLKYDIQELHKEGYVCDATDTTETIEPLENGEGYKITDYLQIYFTKITKRKPEGY